jgi:hypothetical protein
MIQRLFRALGLALRRKRPLAGGLPLTAGDLLSIPEEDGRFSVAKILAVDERGVHVRLYVQRFEQLPLRVDPAHLSTAPFGPGHENPFSIGHMPLSHATFATWQPELIARGTAVVDEELEGYRMWLDAKGGYF